MAKFGLVDLSDHGRSISEKQLRMATLAAMSTCLEAGEIEMPYSVYDLTRFRDPNGVLVDQEAHEKNIAAFRKVTASAFWHIGIEIEHNESGEK